MLALFALGFRPFFLLSGLFAILSVALWVPTFAGWLPLNTYYGQIGWHSHEMIFGYTAAVIAWHYNLHKVWRYIVLQRSDVLVIINTIVLYNK